MIPNLSSLRALINLSETGSITRTADALSLTQSAVSHKMKALEITLGFTLFTRDGRGIRLTSRATQYVAEIAPALDMLARASGPAQVQGTLRLNVSPGFAAYWMAPRLAGFTRNHPDLRIHLTTARTYGDLGTREDDLYVSFATSDQVPKSAIHLMDAAFFPVASPAFLSGQPVRNASDLQNYPLLHLNGVQDWESWLENAGITDPKVLGGVIFQDMQIMQAAAIGGQGLALGDAMSCADALARGELIRAYNAEQKSPRSYWLIEGKGTQSAASEAFASWLMTSLSDPN